jgi:hypothetical protein
LALAKHFPDSRTIISPIKPKISKLDPEMNRSNIEPIEKKTSLDGLMHCECQAEALQPQLIQRCSGGETLLGARWVHCMDEYD